MTNAFCCPILMAPAAGRVRPPQMEVTVSGVEYQLQLSYNGAVDRSRGNRVMTFGARLRELRQKRGMTQEQLAAAAGTAGPYVSDMERGIKVPSLTTIIRLAIALDCKVTNLVRVFDRADLPALVK